MVAFLRNRPRMRAKALAEHRSLTFRGRAKWRCITIVIVRADQMVFL